VEHLEQRYREHHRDDRSPDFIWAQPERTKLFSELVGGPGRRVLDLGCRYGALTEYYTEGNDVTGVDIDREALEHAEARLGIQALWADLDDPLAFLDATFDVVVLGEVLEHIREPERLIGQAHRVHPEDNPTHLHLFAPDDIRELLADFAEPRLHFVAGRLTRLHPRWFANVIVFSATKPE